MKDLSGKDEKMKSMRVKKAVVTALVAVMMAGSIGVMPQGGSVVQAAEPEIKDVNLGTKGISNPNPSTAEEWQGSKVYYAGKLCYVLDKDGQLGGNSSVGGSMLLLTEKVINSQAFNTRGLSDWSTSSVRENLKSTSLAEAEGGFLRSFSAVEQSWIADTSISKDNTTCDYPPTNYPSDSTKDKLFLLDLADVKNFAYGFDGDAARVADSWWWLRSPGRSTNYAARVDVYGSVSSGGGDVSNEGGSVRPAFNLNLSSVLFTSVSEANKSVFDLVGKDKVDNTWKLTLKDGDGDFAATIPETAEAGQEVTVNVTTKGTGSYNQTSAILADGQGTVVAYGGIGDPGTGDKILKIPDNLARGQYKLHVFEEQANERNLTNYASNVATKEIKIVSNVNITAGNFMTKTIDSGKANQPGLIGAMEAVVYTANSGYYFPDNYVSTIAGLTDGALNGIGVTRNDSTQITISGTPTVTTTITLTAPIEKAEQGKPTGLSDGVDKIAGTKTTMQYAARADAPANEWLECTDGDTTVTPGTWYVRYKETDTKKAGAAAEVTVSQSPSRYDVTITWGDHMTKTSDSGEVKQTGLTGAMKAVVYTADAGFYFPTDYSVAPVNGISVKRDDYTQITVSGTPTANATIHLIKPTEKDQQDAPTGLSDGVEKIAGTKTTMEYAASADATADAWKACTDGNTTVKAGTWYVRYKETDTKKAGATAAVTVTAPKTPTPKPTYTITDGAGTAYTIGSGKTLTITCSGPLADLTGIYVDEKQVDAKHYTVKSGSTILTLKTSYLDSLSVGTHNLTFAYGKETAKTTFEIKAAAAKATTPTATTPTAETPAKKDVSPKTGDQTSTLWLLLLVLASAAGACYMGKKRGFVK